MGGWGKHSVSVIGTVVTPHSSQGLQIMWGERERKKNPDKNTHYHLVIWFWTILHFLQYSDLNYWLQSASCSQIRDVSSVSRVKFLPTRTCRICFLGRWTQSRRICLRTFCQPLPINEDQRGAVTCPKSHSTLGTELGLWPTLLESQSKLLSLTAHDNFTEILYSRYQCPLYVNSSSSSKQAVHCTELEGQSRAFPPIFCGTYRPIFPLLLLKFQKVFDASDCLYPHPTYILGCIPVVQRSGMYCSGLRIASDRKHNLKCLNLKREFIGSYYWKVQGVNWLLIQEKLDLAM